MTGMLIVTWLLAIFTVPGAFANWSGVGSHASTTMTVSLQGTLAVFQEPEGGGKHWFLRVEGADGGQGNIPFPAALYQLVEGQPRDGSGRGVAEGTAVQLVCTLWRPASQECIGVASVRQLQLQQQQALVAAVTLDTAAAASSSSSRRRLSAAGPSAGPIAGSALDVLVASAGFAAGTFKRGKAICPEVPPALGPEQLANLTALLGPDGAVSQLFSACSYGITNISSVQGISITLEQVCTGLGSSELFVEDYYFDYVYNRIANTDYDTGDICPYGSLLTASLQRAYSSVGPSLYEDFTHVLLLVPAKIRDTYRCSNLVATFPSGLGTLLYFAPPQPAPARIAADLVASFGLQPLLSDDDGKNNDTSSILLATALVCPSAPESVYLGWAQLFRTATYRNLKPDRWHSYRLPATWAQRKSVLKVTPSWAPYHYSNLYVALRGTGGKGGDAALDPAFVDKVSVHSVELHLDVPGHPRFYDGLALVGVLSPPSSRLEVPWANLTIEAKGLLQGGARVGVRLCRWSTAGGADGCK